MAAPGSTNDEKVVTLTSFPFQSNITDNICASLRRILFLEIQQKIHREKYQREPLHKICSAALCYLFFGLYDVSIFAKNLFNHNAFSDLYGYGEL